MLIGHAIAIRILHKHNVGRIGDVHAAVSMQHAARNIQTFLKNGYLVEELR
jgi:hypothetical protein